MRNVRCALCDKVMDLARPHYHEETGWVKPRRHGGTNALSLRQLTGRFAHWECVDLAKLKVSPAQERLI